MHDWRVKFWKRQTDSKAAGATAPPPQNCSSDSLFQCRTCGNSETFVIFMSRGTCTLECMQVETIIHFCTSIYRLYTGIHNTSITSNLHPKYGESHFFLNAFGNFVHFVFVFPKCIGSQLLNQVRKFANKKFTVWN
jgi:hypothetical protein